MLGCLEAHTACQGGNGSMWCSPDLRDSHLVNNSRRSTSCTPSLPEAWWAPGERRKVMEGSEGENPCAIQPLPGEEGECGGQPGALPSHHRLVMRSCLLVKVPSPVCIIPSLCACSGSSWTRQLLACFSSIIDVHYYRQHWTDSYSMLYWRVRKDSGEGHKWRRHRTEWRKGQSSLWVGSPQFRSVFILVILSHQLHRRPSCKAVSLSMSTCGWEAGNFRTEER